MSDQGLGPGVEFDRIRAVTAALAGAALGIGDDCGEIPAGPGTLLISTDSSVEHVHFRRDWLSLQEIGWRATAAALSDLAAMGATVRAVVVALVLPADITDAETAELMRGAGEAASLANAPIVGGDLTRGTDLVLTVTVIGAAERPVRRDGARRGDGVWVTGTLGGAHAALEAWLGGQQPVAGARAAFAHPVPRLEAGRWLAAHGATAMIDLRDGLAGDARHLAAASAVAVEIDLDRLLLGAAVASASEAALGGEDYELLVALPASFGPAEAVAFAAAVGLPLTRIGTVREGSGLLLLQGGQPLDLQGFDHFGAGGRSR